MNKWLNKVNESNPNIPKVLVGTKCDLTANKSVAAEFARDYANSIGIDFFETSSKSGINIDIPFRTLATKVLGKYIFYCFIQ